jgi:hypothetical protein
LKGEVHEGPNKSPAADLLFATGSTRPEAWWRACEQAAAVGMLAAPKSPLSGRR